jgi:hypothetical protein
VRDAAGNTESTTQQGRGAADGGGGAVVIGAEVNADEPAVKLVRGDKGGTGTGEVMEDDVVRFRECCDQGFERPHGLLRRRRRFPE